MGRRSSLQLMRLFGVRIGVDYSWFLILFLAIFWLQSGLRDVIDASSTTIYLAAVAGAFLGFGSIVFHELGHALAARREGLQVDGIDLFLFGGVMKMRSEPASPGAEFRVSAAGPFATALLIGIFFAIAAATEGVGELWDAATLSREADVSMLAALLSILVSLNVFLLIFNLVPAYPLDGGRIARAVVWRLTGDRNKATRFSAALGRAFSGLLFVFALYLFAQGAIGNAIWMAALGWLLGQAARGAVAQTAFTERLEGITAADIMDAEPVVIAADMSAERAFEDYFLRYGWDWFAVVEPDGRYVGRAFRNPVQEAAQGANAAVTVREITGADSEGRVADDAPLEALLTSEALRRLGAVMAVDAEGRLRGVVTMEAVSQALRAQLVVPGRA